MLHDSDICEGCVQLIGHVKQLCHGKMSLQFAGASGTGICRTTDIAFVTRQQSHSPMFSSR